MSQVGDIRQAIRAAVMQIPGLDSTLVLDSVEPPCLIVRPPAIAYDSTMANGAMDLTFELLLLVSRADETGAQDYIDTFTAPVGTKSIKNALETSDALKALEATALTVKQCSDIQQALIGEATYWAVVLTYGPGPVRILQEDA